MAFALMIGAIAARVEAPEFAVVVMAGALILTVLGLHLVPLPWWRRGLLALIYLPLVSACWLLGTLAVGCSYAKACF